MSVWITLTWTVTQKMYIHLKGQAHLISAFGMRGLILSTLPSLMRFLFQRVALCPGFDGVKCAGDSFCYHVYSFICLSFESSLAHNKDAAGRPLGAALPAKWAFFGAERWRCASGELRHQEFWFLRGKASKWREGLGGAPQSPWGAGQASGCHQLPWKPRRK